MIRFTYIDAGAELTYFFKAAKSRKISEKVHKIFTKVCLQMFDKR